MLQKLEDASSGMRVSGGLQALTAMGLVLFGAHIRHLLLRREPEGAMTPTVAWGGALLAAAMTATAGAVTQLLRNLFAPGKRIEPNHSYNDVILFGFGELSTGRHGGLQSPTPRISRCSSGVLSENSLRPGAKPQVTGTK